MNTKLLKQKILDLAIRGKLTQQLKSDGTARELLEQISSKVSSSSSILSSPRRRGSPSPSAAKTIIPLDKSEVPFEVPANWEWVRLGDLCKASSGKTPSTSQKEFWNGNVLWVTSKDVKQKYIDSTQICLSDLGASSMQLYPPKTMIIVGRSGILRHSLPVAILKKSATVNQDLKALVFKDNRIVEFIYAVIKGMEQHLLHEYKKAGTTVDNLNFDLFLTAPIPLPPLAEQQRIVAKIEEAFAEIDSIENNKELLKTHIKQARQKILDLAIHGKLVPQNKADEPARVLLERITRDNPHYEKIEDEPFEIPENWAWCRLRNLSESIQYGYNAPAKDSGRIKMVRISDIHENEVEWNSVPYCDIDEKEIQTYLLKKNDILFARTGGTVGKSFIVNNLPEDAVYAGYLIRTRYGKNANAQYMKYFMESNLYWEQLRDGCIATAQPNCNGKTLGKMKIPLPPLNEQSRIVAKIEELFSTLDQMERNLV